MKQALITKTIMTETVYNFENYDLEFVSNFDIRISGLFYERVAQTKPWI